MTKENLIILKIGGSIITNKDSEDPIFLNESAKRISIEIKNSLSHSNFKLLIVHGAGSFGHPIVKKSGIYNGIKNSNQLLDLSKTINQVKELNSLVCEKLIQQKIAVFPYDLSSQVIMDNKLIEEFDLDLIKNLLSKNLIPVLYGTMVYDKSQTCSVLSGDKIISYLAKKLEKKYDLKTVIFATDVDGIYDKNPKINEDAKLIKELNGKQDLNLSNSHKFDVTKGMIGKLEEIYEFNTNTLILNGKIEKNIEKALNGELIGTIIKK